LRPTTYDSIVESALWPKHTHSVRRNSKISTNCVARLNYGWLNRTTRLVEILTSYGKYVFGPSAAVWAAFSRACATVKQRSCGVADVGKMGAYILVGSTKDRLG